MKIQHLVQTVLLIVVIALIGCKNTQTFTKDNLPKKRLEFGTYNVNSGVKVQWIFLENGQVFYQNNLFIAAQKRLSKEAIQLLFQEAAKVERSKFRFFQDGSYTAFITYNGSKTGNGTLWQWPYGGSKDYPDELKKLYLMLEDAAKASYQEVIPE